MTDKRQADTIKDNLTGAVLPDDFTEDADVSAYIVNDMENEIRHGMCVSLLAGKVARDMKLDHNFCHDIEIAGMLHDIGKLRISRYIYGRRENTMQIEEMQYLRRHSSLGYDILRQQGFSEDICDMVLYHHENYDGSGYPYNLRRDDIPLGARIIRVCDVFAALSADRPYREAFPFEKATEMMIDEVKEFDMKIFLAFQNVIHSEDIKEELLAIKEQKFMTTMQEGAAQLWQ